MYTHGNHKADNDLPESTGAVKLDRNPLYVLYKAEKELNGGAVVEEVCCIIKRNQARRRT